MVFSSLLFLCLFFPLVLLVYYVAPRKIRNFLLLAASLLFYAWGEPKYVVVMLISIVFGYACGLLIAHFRERKNVARFFLVLSLAGNLGILCFFKYTDFIIKTWNSLTKSGVSLLGLALPIGISFYTFQILSYTIDVYWGRTRAQKNLIDFGMFVCLFPQLIAGPIVKYTDIETEIRGRRETVQDFYAGFLRFCVGLGKKVILSNQIGALWTEISGIGTALPAGTAWIGALAYTFQIYFDFSGYSDMAIGMGKMLGFHFPENFNYPYVATSITDFWRRWHMTLSGWFREYVYIPLGGNRCRAVRHIFNLLVVWFLTGLWHGAGWNFILWGLFYFGLLVLEKFFLLKRLERLPNVIRRLYTMFFVVIGWVIFSVESLPQMGGYLKSLFGAGGVADAQTLYYLQSYGFLFVILALGATKVPKRAVCWIWSRMEGRSAERGEQKKKRAVLRVSGEFVYMVAVLGISLILLVGDSYNPFLYFRF